MTSHLEEALKTILIYLDKDSEPLPLKFYPGTDSRDIASTVKETVENIKTHSNKDNLKAFQKTSTQPLDIENIDQEALLELSRIILAEDLNDDLFDTQSPEKFKTQPDFQDTDNDEIFSGKPIITHGSESQRIYKAFTLKSHIMSSPPVVDKVGPKHDSTPKKRPGSALQGLRSPKSMISSPNKLSGPRVINLEEPSNCANNGFKNLEVQGSEWRTGEIGTKPLDGDDPQIYSTKVGCPPLSYLTGNVVAYDPKCPPPVYATYEELCQNYKHFNKEDIFKLIEITSAGEAKVIDLAAIKAMRGVLSELVKKILHRLATGKSIFGVPFPVRIFEPQAFHEKLFDWMLYLGNYLPKAAESTDPIERMKYIVTFVISSMHNVTSKVRRPFNALMGETTQLEWPELGISACVEQTVHQPPSVNYYIVGRGFKFWGKISLSLKVEPNAGVVHLDGENHIQFSDGQHIKFEWPYYRASGFMFGDRLGKFINTAKFYDVQNKIKSIVKLGERGDNEKLPKKRVDTFIGKIYRYDPSQTEGKKLSQKQIAKIDNNYSDLTEQICELYGQAFSYLVIDGKEFWNRDKDLPIRPVPVKNPLPSDNRFREDILWVKRGNLNFAQEWKEKLEERQRNDRKMRNKRKGKHADDD